MANTAAINEQIVTPQEIATNHVQSSADNLIGKPAQEVKKVFDKLPELAIQKHNALINELSGINGASSIGTIGNSTVQAEIDDRYKKAEVYSKAQTNDEINNRIIVIGASDMQQAVYDKGGKKEDIFDYTEKAIATAATTAKKDLDTAIKEHSKAPMHAKDCSHTRAGTTHMLQLLSPLPPISIRETAYVTLRFKAKADYVAGDKFNINGKIFTGKPVGEETTLPDKVFVTGDVVSATYHAPNGTVLFFKLGGGGGFPKPWQETVTAPARETIAKNDAIVYQEFGDLLTTPTALTPSNGTSLGSAGQISGNGEYIVCTSPNGTTPNAFVVKIDKVTDTYYKLPELPSQPALNNTTYSKWEGAAISNDGDIIAFIKKTENGSTSEGMLNDFFIEYYTKNSNETYTKCNDFKFAQSAGQMHEGLPRFATFVGHDNLFIQWQRCGYTLINFTNKQIPKIVSSSNGEAYHGYSNAAVDYSGCFVMALERYNKPCKYHFYYSSDGGMTIPMSEIGTCIADANNSMYSNYISGTAGYAVMSYASHPQGGNLGKYIQISPNGVVPTSAEDSFINTYTNFFTSDGRYFLYLQNNVTSVYDASTAPILNKTPLSTFNFAINGMEYMSSNGEYACSSDGKIYRLRKKTYIEKLDSVYALSVLSKNDTFKVGLGVSLQNANVGQDCKANLFTPINNKLGNFA